MKKLSSLANAYKIEVIAIGNGTASKETEGLAVTLMIIAVSFFHDSKLIYETLNFASFCPVQYSKSMLSVGQKGTPWLSFGY